MMERRQAIAENTPHIETASGKTFEIVVAEPETKEIVANLRPRQAGSGAPSVNNKRAIAGWSWPKIAIDGDSYTSPASLGGVLWGSFNFKTGYKVSEYTSQTLSGGTSVTSYSKSGNSSIFWGYFGNIVIYNAVYKPLFCNMFSFVEYSYDYAGVPDWSFCGASAYPNSAWFKVPTSVLPAASLDGVKQWLNTNSIQMVGPRTGGARTTFVGAVDVPITRGLHLVDASDTISDTGAEITYWTH